MGGKKYLSHTHFNSDRIRVPHTDKKSSPYLYLNCHWPDLEDSLSGGPRRATAIFLSIFPSVRLKGWRQLSVPQQLRFVSTFRCRPHFPGLGFPLPPLSRGPRRATAIFLSIFPSVGLKGWRRLSVPR
jgi:hypothetical protein